MNAVERPLSLWNANALMDFKQFMATAIALFKPDFYRVDQISGGPHLYFSETSNWQQVREANKYDGAFLWVEAELEKGFNIADMNQLKWMLGQQDKSCTIMMARGRRDGVRPSLSDPPYKRKFKIRMSSMNKSVLYTLRYLVQNGNSTFLAT